jgi:hypothetical protein
MTSPLPPETGFGTGTGQGTSPLQQDPQPQSFDARGAIDRMYQENLGRGSDQGGLDYWTNQLNSGTSLADIQNAIRGSQEGQNYQNDYTINAFYNSILGRNAEPTKLDFYRNALQNGSSMDDIVNAISGSDEAKKYKESTIPPISSSDHSILNPYHDPNPQVSPLEVNPMGENPYHDPNPQVSPLEVNPMVPSEPTDQRSPFNIYDENGNVIGYKDPGPTKEDQDIFFGVKPNPSDPYGEEAYWKAAEDQRKGILPQSQIDPYSTDNFSNPGKSTGFTPDGIFGKLSGFSGIPQTAGNVIDPVYDFVTNIDQQPQYLQHLFQTQLQKLGDPVAAGHAVLGTLK